MSGVWLFDIHVPVLEEAFQQARHQLQVRRDVQLKKWNVVENELDDVLDAFASWHPLAGSAAAAAGRDEHGGEGRPRRYCTG